MGDLALFEACVSGPAVAYAGDCLKADFDRDADVDMGDYGLFQRCYSGAGTRGCGDAEMGRLMGGEWWGALQWGGLVVGGWGLVRGLVMADGSGGVVAGRTEGQGHALQCMEIVGGNHTTEQLLSAPGLDIWVSSRPHRGDAGGDVYYFSMCGSGRVTRLAMADISGHGAEADETARWLRALMRKHINLLDQTRLARAINAEFPSDDAVRRFATVLFVTYFAPTQHLIVCNAGHPRPIWFSRRTGQWQLLDEDTPGSGSAILEAKGTYRLRRVANLPIGVIEPTDYYQFAVKLEPGDLVLVYTDALIEACSPAGALLGEEGLLRLAGELESAGPEQFARALLAKVAAWRGHGPAGDDETLVALRQNGTAAPRLTVAQALKSAAKMVGLVRV